MRTSIDIHTVCIRVFEFVYLETRSLTTMVFIGQFQHHSLHVHHLFGMKRSTLNCGKVANELLLGTVRSEGVDVV